LPCYLGISLASDWEPDDKRTLRAPLHFLFLATILAVALPLPSLAQQSDKTEIIKKARQSYYSLKAEGFNQATCSMVPNWNFLLEEQRKADAANIDAAIKKLEGLRFMLAVDAEGKATVTHNDLPAENDCTET
jgi:hypothetical protein